MRFSGGGGGSAVIALLLAACGGDPGPDAQDAAAGAVAPTAATMSAPVLSSPSRTVPASARPAGDAIRACRDTIGAAPADRLARQCRAVSPATPCDAANSCAMIEDEIARSCVLFEGEGAPLAGCATPPGGMEAAADVVRRYYSAIDARDFATAWRQWGDDGPPGQPLPDFARGYARTRQVRVGIGAMQPGDAGAGSSYQQVPVTVDAVLDDGTRQRFRGRYTLRRVNDVDGATAAQRRWHIDGADLRAAAP